MTQAGAPLLLSNARIQYGLTRSKALERSASKAQEALELSRKLWIAVTALAGSLNIDMTV